MITSDEEHYRDFNNEAAELLEQQCPIAESEIVSFSEVYKFQTCRRAWYYQFYLGLRSEETDAIGTGNRGHKLLQNFYLLLKMGHSKEKALKLITAQAKEEMKEDIDGNLLKAWVLVDNYIRETDFNSKAIHVEGRFLVPAKKLTNDTFFDSVQIGFTPDLVLERTGGFIDIEDYKFVQRKWSQKKVNRFPQLRVYHLLMEAMGYTISRTVLREFNTQTGKIFAHPYPMSSVEKENVLKDFLSGVSEVLNFRRSINEETSVATEATRTMNYTACQFCHFERPCTMEAQGKNANYTLSTEYTKSSYNYGS